jgi:hypothetical protein
MECHGMPWNAMETQGKLWKFIEGSRRSRKANGSLCKPYGMSRKSHGHLMEHYWNVMDYLTQQDDLSFLTQQDDLSFDYSSQL